jgi:hypothetical protein
MEPKDSLPCSKNPPPDPILNQPKPVRPTETYLPKVHLNVILSPAPRFSNGLFPGEAKMNNNNNNNKKLIP